MNTPHSIPPLVRLPKALEDIIRSNGRRPTRVDIAKMPSECRAYFAWVRRVLKTKERLPLAKIAWDAGVEWGRNHP